MRGIAGTCATPHRGIPPSFPRIQAATDRMTGSHDASHPPGLHLRHFALGAALRGGKPRGRPVTGRSISLIVRASIELAQTAPPTACSKIMTGSKSAISTRGNETPAYAAAARNFSSNSASLSGLSGIPRAAPQKPVAERPSFKLSVRRMLSGYFARMASVERSGARFTLTRAMSADICGPTTTPGARSSNRTRPWSTAQARA